MTTTHLTRNTTFLLLALFATSIRADEAAEALILSTYKLANESSTATGFVIHLDEESPKFLVTARHVLQQMKGDTFKLVARTKHANGTYSRREITLPLRAEGKTLWKGHSKHDVAILQLPADVDVNSLPFECLADEQTAKQVHTGDNVRSAVFPERSEANNAGFPMLRSGVIASHPIVPVRPHPIFLIDTTTWQGDSGGPIMHANLRSPNGYPLILGIVRGMRNITDTQKESRFVERRTHYPLGIGEITHVTFARELIAAMVK